LEFNARSVIVDPNNKWDQVALAGPKWENAWRSQGLVIRLPWELRDSELLAPALGEHADTKVKNGHVNGSPNGSRATDALSACPTSSSSPLAALVERISGGAGALHSMDSMQAIQLVEGIRREFGRALSVTDVLRCGSVDELAEAMQKATGETSSENVDVGATGMDGQYRRIWLCGMGPRACTVDWLVCREDQSTHLDISSLTRALGQLIVRHGALRARNYEEQPMFLATYDAASLWQLWCSSKQSWTRTKLGKWASDSVFEAWPRSTLMQADTDEARVELLRPRVSDVLVEDSGWQPSSSDEFAFWVGLEIYKRRERNERLFSICVVPIFKTAPGASPDSDAVTVALSLPPHEVQWYIYAVLDHGYCDGPAGLPLFADLLRLYEWECGHPGAEAAAKIPDALGVLEQRLRKSLQTLPEAEHPNDDIFHDGLVHEGYREGFQRFIQFDTDIMQLLRYAAESVLGCSVDVAWLTAISAAFIRVFPGLKRLDLFLIVTCRDKPAEETMVGYFSSRKMLPLELGDPTRLALLGLSDMISTARRQRNWHRPRPYEKFSSACIEVNVVGQATHGLPAGFREARYAKSAPRSWNRGGTSPMQVRLDQTGRDAWDFRLQSHEGSWGGDWSTYYAQALGSVIVDMACRSTGPIVHRASTSD
jgi:hypothetical protein